MTTSKAFTAVATGNQIILPPKRTATATVTVAHGKSYIGTLLLERSRTQGQTWETVRSFDGSTVAIPEDTTLTETVENSTGAIELYRFRSSLISTDAATGAIATVAGIVQQFATPGGAVIATMYDDGTMTITAASLTNIAALMIAWLATLPTVEPVTVGEPYLNSGVLTISNGP